VPRCKCLNGFKASNFRILVLKIIYSVQVI